MAATATATLVVIIIVVIAGARPWREASPVAVGLPGALGQALVGVRIAVRAGRRIQDLGTGLLAVGPAFADGVAVPQVC